MTITTPNQFVIKKYEGAGGNFIDSNYLGALGETGKPYVFENLMLRLYSSRSQFMTNKPLLGMTAAKDGAMSGGNIEIDQLIYRWRLQGAEHRYGIILENLESTNTTPGLNGSLIRIKTDIDYYKEPDVLNLEDPEYPLEIIGSAVPDGAGYIYTLRLMTDNPAVFVPAELLEAGRRLNKMTTSVVQELNDRGGTIQSPSSMMLESQIGSFAMEGTVTDEAWRTQGMLTIPFKVNGTQVTKYLPMFENKLNETFYQDIEAALWYGKRSVREGFNKYTKYTGPGLREQMKDSWNKYTASPWTEDLLFEFLMDIYFARIDEDDRKTAGFSGTVGKMMLHRLLAARAQSLLTLDTHWVQKLSENPNHLSYGAQFTYYKGIAGIEFSMQCIPNYDSTRYNNIPHPFFPNKPIDSGRLSFTHWGSSKKAEDGQYNNIMSIKRKNTFRSFYVPGSFTPSGPIKSGAANSKVAGYTHFMEGTMGIVMFDPTMGGELITDVNNI